MRKHLATLIGITAVLTLTTVVSVGVYRVMGEAIIDSEMLKDEAIVWFLIAVLSGWCGMNFASSAIPAVLRVISKL